MLKDNIKYGLLLGAFGPFLGIIGFYLWKLRSASFIEYLQLLLSEKRFLTNVLTFSLFVNIVIFTIFINTDRYKTGKGIFISSCVWGVAALILKFVY